MKKESEGNDYQCKKKISEEKFIMLLNKSVTTYKLNIFLPLFHCPLFQLFHCLYFNVIYYYYTQ